VSCLSGSVLDAVVDLRVGSPTFGKHVVLELCADSGAVFAPAGCAHGFFTTSEEALVLYATSRDFNPDLDAGIRWDSAGIEGPGDAPTVSPRDLTLPRPDDFQSQCHAPTFTRSCGRAGVQQD
jgi:dTDP-4-dehydrorhamnose 3,5-epimerase